LSVDFFGKSAEVVSKKINGNMISNERPSPYGRRPYQSQGYGTPKYNSQPRPPVNEDTLKSAEVQIERKNFVLTLKENPRGRFLRVTEDVGGRRDTIIIPSTGLADFKKLLDEMVKAADEIPSKVPPPEQPEAGI
jgi:hypothetical protein